MFMNFFRFFYFFNPTLSHRISIEFLAPGQNLEKKKMIHIEENAQIDKQKLVDLPKNCRVRITSSKLAISESTYNNCKYKKCDW